MSEADDLSACAGLLARGDPWRFRATMAAPVVLRRILLPLYAFNVEVARAPWLTREPLIAEMRLRWWRDALAEIAAGGAVRRHEVVTPLAAALDAKAASDLDALVEARRGDIDGPRFAARADLLRYLDATAGTLLWTASRLAGFADEAAARDGGLAQGIAAWLRAAPDLVARGRDGLPPGDPAQAVSALAEEGLAAMARFRQARPPPGAASVFLALWNVEAELRAFRRAPERTPPADGIASRLRLLRATARGRP